MLLAVVDGSNLIRRRRFRSDVARFESFHGVASPAIGCTERTSYTSPALAAFVICHNFTSAKSPASPDAAFTTHQPSSAGAAMCNDCGKRYYASRSQCATSNISNPSVPRGKASHKDAETIKSHSIQDMRVFPRNKHRDHRPFYGRFFFGFFFRRAPRTLDFAPIPRVDLACSQGTVGSRRLL